MLKGLLLLLLLMLYNMLRPLTIEVVWCLVIEAKLGCTILGITPLVLSNIFNFNIYKYYLIG